MKDFQEQLSIIKRGVVELITEDELISKLKEDRPLRIKAGFDPTAPDLHLGHTVLLTKLRQFQDLGHQVIFLIGDFTAIIGDPTGRSETRPRLSPEEVKKNAVTYQEQVFKILDPQKTDVRFNSEWLGKMSPLDWATLGAKQTVARMLERDDFKKRMRAEEDITILEFYYPLLQAYDSVVIESDVEIGGSDQKFNLLMGRTIQKRSNQSPQIVLTLPLLEGTDGIQKMSKSYGNAIAIKDSPQEIFGKIMSISDDLMGRYYELLSLRDLREIDKTAHPKKIKADLGKELVARFYSEAEALKAEQQFDEIFKAHHLPEAIEEVQMKKSDKPVPLVDLLMKTGLTQGKGEGRRLIEQGGVKINQKKADDTTLTLTQDGDYILQVGKRKFKRVVFH